MSPTGQVTSTESASAHAQLAPGRTRSRTIAWQDPAATAAAGARLAGIDYMRALAAGELPPPPIAVLMRMQPVELEPGRAVFEGDPSEEHYNPIGVVHGGYAATLLDSALGCAVHTTLAAGQAYTTLTLELKLVRPVTADVGRVRAAAEVLYRGRRQATAQAKLTDATTGKLLAHGTSTCMVIDSP